MRRWLLACVALAAGACGGGDPATVRVDAGTPIVFVSIDTLRSDRLPAYGYKKVETPALDRLAREGLVFEHAYAHTPLTLPSHASALTGTLPAVHGVRDNVGYLLDPKRLASGALPSLPALLQKRGYATGGGISAFVLRGKTGISHGFDFYEDSIEFASNTGLGGLQRPGLETLGKLRPWLDQQRGKPFFLFFHLYEPHTPYLPPPDLRARYAAEPYDGEIAAADRVVATLLADLERLGVYDDAAIFVFSDHGEGLGDHGEEEHGVLLYREAIQVPLIVRLPGGELGGTRVAAPAQLADLAPTVLALLGETPPAAMSGLNLLSLVREDAPLRPIVSETFYPRLHFGWSDLASVIDSRHHYIEGPDPELYNLAQDPQERKNVLREERRPFAELREALAGYDRTLVPPAEVDEESRAALAALGYIGSVGGTETEGPLPDPKSQLGTLALLKAGFGHHAKGEWAQAVATFEKVLAANPRMVDALEYLGRALERLDRPQDALAAYRRALEVSQGAPNIALVAASLYLELGQLKEAEEHARLALVAHPSFAHGVLAQVALARKDTAAAEREARAALEAGESRVGPQVILASVLLQQKRLDEALKLTEEAEKAYGEREAKDKHLIRGLYVTRGQALADQGRAAEAERAFLQEIELFPQDLRAYSSLAILYALTGRTGDVPVVLRRMVEARPIPTAYAEAVKTLRILGDPASAKSLLAFAQNRFPGSPELAAVR